MSKAKRGINKLADELREGKSALVITGAGLSVPSGIAAYRTGKNGIWNRFLTEWGTKERFLQNPLKWYNTFWLKTHENRSFFYAKPNPGHYSISNITQKCLCRVITQNIDCLHSKTPLHPDLLIEVHGRLGYYRCSNGDCIYSTKKPITDLDITKYGKEGTSFEDGTLELQECPECSLCGSPVLPLALFFDELYASHSYFQWEKCLQWMQEADLFVFVGTSFSVGVTRQAIEVAEEYDKSMYNFNIAVDKEVENIDMTHILGSADVTLPLLDKALLRSSDGRKRLFHYRAPNYKDLKIY